ncbi:hypothetical protein [Haladaptatus halobius]|uniref:hypothetical protein n=1 Tax=Haladaptatus halobius TaxID=2884875 RepID=UPI001D0AA014|nr:hypothetical protein [Haladaptatus halobius]
MIGLNAFSTIVLQIGTSEINEPIYGGAIIFGAAALALYYLGYVRTEMNPGIILRIGPFVMLLFTLLALFWPWRPWPH